nr:MAG TPA: hypothetical protein [Caudoviricetes sp.]
MTTGLTYLWFQLKCTLRVCVKLSDERCLLPTQENKSHLLTMCPTSCIEGNC